MQLVAPSQTPSLPSFISINSGPPAFLDREEPLQFVAHALELSSFSLPRYADPDGEKVVVQIIDKFTREELGFLTVEKRIVTVFPTEFDEGYYELEVKLRDTNLNPQESTYDLKLTIIP